MVDGHDDQRRAKGSLPHRGQGPISREISEKVTRAQLQLAQQGFKMGGGSIYGFHRMLLDQRGNPKFLLTPGQRKAIRTDRVRFVLGTPKEQEVIRSIFQLCVVGMLKPQQIAEQFRMAGLSGTDGRAWTAQMVLGVLTSELCIGRSVYNKISTKLQSRLRKNPVASWVRTSANTNLINAALSSGAGSAANGASSPARKIAISFLFAARATASVKQFDARVTSVQGNKNDQAAKQSERLAGGTGTLVSASSGMSETTTGGNTVLQADQETYSVLSPEDVNAAMSQVFSDSGFDVYDYRDVNTQCGGAKPDLLYSSFSTSDTLSPDLRKSAFDSAKKCQVNTFATGTLDVGLQDTDPVTGQKRVYVSVRMQVNDLSAILPKLLASVGPVQYSGLGPTQDVARRNALINAATEAAKEISNQLKSKGMN